jgi:hypothetical protein
VEIDMPYRERVGESKLKVGKDGLRFFNIIAKTAITYRPLRTAGIVAAGVAATAAGLWCLLRRRRS